MKGSQRNVPRSGSKNSEQKIHIRDASQAIESIPGFDMTEVIIVQATTIETLLNKLKEAQDRIHELEESNLELVKKLSDNIMSRSKKSIDRVSSHPHPMQDSKSIASETKVRIVRENRLKSYDQPRQGSSEKLLSRSDSFQKTSYHHANKMSQIPNNPSLSNLNWQMALDNPSVVGPQSARQTTRYQLSIVEQNMIPDELDVMMYQDTDFRQTPRSQTYLPQQPKSNRESRVKSPNIQMPVAATNLEIQEVSPSRSLQKQTISIKEALSMSQPALNQFESDFWASELTSPGGHQRPVPVKPQVEVARNNHQHLSSGRYVLEKIREDLTQEVSNPTSGRRRSTQVEIETKQSSHAPPLRAEQEYRTGRQSAGVWEKVPMRPTNISKYSVGGARQPVVAKRHPKDEHRRKEVNSHYEPHYSSRTDENIRISTTGPYDFKIALSNYENLSMMLSQKKEAAKNYSLSVISEIAGVSSKPRKKKSSSSRGNREPDRKLKLDFGIRNHETKDEIVNREPEPSLFVGGTEKFTYTPSNYHQKCLSERSRGGHSDGGVLSHRAQLAEGSYGGVTGERSKFDLDAKLIKLSDDGQSKPRISQYEDMGKQSPTTMQASVGLGHFYKDFSWAVPKPGPKRPYTKGSQREVYSTYM